MRLLLVAALAAMTCSPAVAQSGPSMAQYGAFFVDPETPEVGVFLGDIAPSAPLDFRRMIKAHPEVRTLALASPGGDVTAALLVAQEVALLGFETNVPKDYGCYSACAFIFLAGETRLVEGELGVHQVSGAKDSDYATQLAVADILDGMAEFGVPASVVSDMLRTPPESMKIYSAADAERIGINRNLSGGEHDPASATLLPRAAAPSALPSAPSYALISTATDVFSGTKWTEEIYQLHQSGSIEATLLDIGLPPDNIRRFIGPLTARIGSGIAPAWSQFVVTSWPYNGQKTAGRVSLYTPEPPDGRLTHRVTAQMDPTGAFHEVEGPE